MASLSPFSPLLLLVSLYLIIRSGNGQTVRDWSIGNNITTNGLPNLPNAIHYPIYVPASSHFSPSMLPLQSGLASSWLLSAPANQLLWSTASSSPFMAEVYDEQQLLAQRDFILKRREEMRKKRDRLRQKQLQEQQQRQEMQQQQQQHRSDPESHEENSHPSQPNLIQDPNPLIPKPVTDEYDYRVPSSNMFTSSRSRASSESQESRPPHASDDSMFEDKSVTDIPASTHEAYLRRQAAFPAPKHNNIQEATQLHYFSTIRRRRQIDPLA